MLPDTLNWYCSIYDTCCNNPYIAAPPTATLDTILVDKSFLMHLLAANHNPEDPKIYKFAQLGISDDPHFHIIHKFSVALLARQVHLEAPMQLVIP